MLHVAVFLAVVCGAWAELQLTVDKTVEHPTTPTRPRFPTFSPLHSCVFSGIQSGIRVSHSAKTTPFSRPKLFVGPADHSKGELNRP